MQIVVAIKPEMIIFKIKNNVFPVALIINFNMVHEIDYFLIIMKRNLTVKAKYP